MDETLAQTSHLQCSTGDQHNGLVSLVHLVELASAFIMYHVQQAQCLCFWSVL